MKNRIFIRMISALTLIILVCSLAGCKLSIDLSGGGIGGSGSSSGGGSGTGSGTGAGGGSGVDFPDDGTTVEPEDWQDGSVDEDVIAVRTFIGEQIDLTEGYDLPADTVWSSECEAVATVAGGTVTGVSFGRTTVTAESDSLKLSFLVTVEFRIISNNGFTVTTDLVDPTEHLVTSVYEANRLLDAAIIAHYHKVTIDFSGISPDFTMDDFDLDSELGNHAYFKTSYYESKPYLVTFEIVYDSEAATTTTPLSEERVTVEANNLNSALRKHFSDFPPRADDYEGFAINFVEEEMEVYNSEELWWAVEHGYRPVFPISGTKAELFYERAKIILRDIISDGMTDYEKVLAIYEYLIENVFYDYDAYYAGAPKSDTCYYLEGVFETGRAVCDGKTKAFVLMCGIEGIPCLRDYGSSLKGGAGHAWNYVSLDGVWYLVDTTEGDQRYGLEQGSGIAEFFGESIEGVSYASFLLPIDSHGDRYRYGEIWHTVFTSDGEYPDASLSYFTNEIAAGYDLVLSSRDEAKAYIEAALELFPEEEGFILTVMLEGEDANVHRLLSDAGDYGLDKAVYTSAYGETTVYIILFKPATAE